MLSTIANCLYFQRPLLREDGAASSSTTIQSKDSQNSEEPTQSRTASKPTTSMPPPILKKSRGPSNTGPRPTARFASPPTSEDETAVDSSAPNSQGSRVVVNPAANDQTQNEENRRTPSGASRMTSHLHVASTAGQRKRPVVHKRPGSQSSTSSDSVMKYQETAASESNVTLGSLTSSEGGQSTGTTTTHRQPRVLAHSPTNPENRHATNAVRRNRQNKKKIPKSHLALTVPKPSITPNAAEPVIQIPAESDPSSQLWHIDDGQANLSTMDDATEYRIGDMDAQAGLLAEANAKSEAQQEEMRLAGGGSQIFRKDHRSKSEGGPKLTRSSSTLIHFQGTDAKSSVSLAPTFAAATGTLDLPHDLDIFQGSASEGKGKGREVADSGHSLFAKRSIQSRSLSNVTLIADAVQSRTPNSGELSQSRSQLTLLLAKDRARTDDQKGTKVRSKDQGKDNGKR
jgi:hypothetical protein